MWEKRKCVIKGCETYAGSGFPMHRFPREEQLLFQWMEFTQVKCVSEQTLICVLHFKSSDYINLHAAKRKLRPNSIPSLLCLFPEQSSEHDLIDEVDISEEETDTGNEFEAEISDVQSVCESKDDESDNDLEQLRKVGDQINEDIVATVTNLSDSGKKCNFVDQEVQTEPESVANESKSVKDKITQTEKWSIIKLMKTDAALKAFTGIKLCVLEALVSSINLIENKKNDNHLCTVKERVVLILYKLKLCLSYECIGVLFGISRSTANNYFVETIHLLHAVLEEAVYFPDKEEITQNMPVYFKNFPDTRIVLDCTVVAVENANCLQCRLKMYSHYKGRQTLKVLIGTIPSGLISFCSKFYGGRVSDNSIFLQSELLEKLIPHEDAVMVDKGFLIQSECDARNIKLIRPPFAKQSEQMSYEDTVKTKGVAAARVHIERIMERLKNFKILKSVIDWDMTKYFDKIIVIISGLVNLSSPIIDKSRFGI